MKKIFRREMTFNVNHLSHIIGPIEASDGNKNFSICRALRSHDNGNDKVDLYMEIINCYGRG